MALYVVGDIQGCFCELEQLLDHIRFEPDKDRLWLTGDLVNRGPHSLSTLRFIRSLGKSAISVLGNHDLHLLAIAHKQSKLRKQDTLSEILQAPDRDELLDWLRHRPLLHYESGYCLIHAGLPPQWDLKLAKTCAREVERRLQCDNYADFFQHLYGDTPDVWSDKFKGWERLRFITNCLTRLRYCDKKGRIDFNSKGPLGSQPKHLLPWFEVPERKSSKINIVFGHWSTLGFRAEKGIYAVDTGCLWGGELTALRLSGKLKKFSIACSGVRKPGKSV